MLGGGDEDALAHQAGGVGDFRDVAADSLDFEVVEIGAAEEDACAGRSRKKSKMNGGAAMKTDSRKWDAAGDCLFELSLH